jgi:hypothetical protein
MLYAIRVVVQHISSAGETVTKKVFFDIVSLCRTELDDFFSFLPSLSYSPV